MLWKRVVVKEMQAALVLIRGRLDEVLGPGEYRIGTWNRDVEIEVRNTLETVLESVHAGTMIRSESSLVDRHFVPVRVGEGRVALLFADDVLIRILGPGEFALLWKSPKKVTVREFDIIAEPAIDPALLPALTRFGALGKWVQFVTVAEQSMGLVFINGTFLKTLEAGVHAFWAGLRSVRVEQMDLRRQVLEVNGQEILTKDKVTLRVNISAEYRVIDPVLTVRTVRNGAETLYRLLQLAVRRTLGTRTLDELLQEKVDIEPGAAEAIRKEMAAAGIEVGSIALKDVVLPGEIRDLLNQVVAAEKRAQANLIHRREETAATRSLLNTARLMEESPILIRLKELETLEKLTEKVGSVTVTGGFEGLLEKLLAR